MKRGGLFVALGLSLSALSAADSSSANPGSETRFLDEMARRLFVEERYDSALSKFLEVHQATPSAEGAYNVAVCAELAKHESLAFEFLAEYFRVASEEHPFFQDAEKRMKELSKDLALVRITSEPPGAHIYVDREELGTHGTTPRTIVVDPGERQIFLKLEDFQTSRFSSLAKKGELRKVQRKLLPASGALNVETNIKSSQITVRVRRQVQVLPQGRNQVPAGRLRISAAAPGYRTAHEELDLVAGDERELFMTLKKLPPATGKLLVDAQGVDAKIYIDGKYRGQAPTTLPNLPVGEHRLRIEAVGFVTRELLVEVKKGQTTYERISFSVFGKGTNSSKH